MADPEHVAIVKSGPNAISRWREQNFFVPNDQPTIYHLNYSLGDRSAGETFEREFIHGRAKLDLVAAYLSGSRLPRADLAHDDLSRADLTGANLRMARLVGTNLQSAHISRANLAHADLTLANMAGCTLIRSDLSSACLSRAMLGGSNFSFSDLQFANLEEANLAGANLSYADLSWANLTGANLRGATLTTTTLKLADMSGADLRGATFTGVDMESAVFVNALLGFTRIVNCDLGKAIGLEMARHSGPSAIALDTVARSGGYIPAEFIAKAGVAAPLQALQDAIRASNRTYPSVLVIGSMQDTQLADKLRTGLSSLDIPTWAIAADDEAAIQSGQVILEHTAFYDALLLLATEAAVASPQTSTYHAQLTGGQRSGANQTIVTLATTDSLLQQGAQQTGDEPPNQVLDFRDWQNADSYDDALRNLATLLTTKRW